LVSVTLRVSALRDGLAVTEVFQRARAEMGYLPLLHTEAEDRAFFCEQVLPSSHVMVAEVDGVIIGFSAVKDGWLDHLYVAPEWQGGGIGGSLLNRAMVEHPKGLSLWAFEANHRAIAFYARAGFVEVRRSDGSGNEEGQPDVQMHWGGTRT
jgi:GNAT superfamily N-acetyltransferase